MTRRPFPEPAGQRALTKFYSNWQMAASRKKKKQRERIKQGEQCFRQESDGCDMVSSTPLQHSAKTGHRVAYGRCPSYCKSDVELPSRRMRASPAPFRSTAVGILRENGDPASQPLRTWQRIQARLLVGWKARLLGSNNAYPAQIPCSHNGLRGLKIRNKYRHQALVSVVSSTNQRISCRAVFFFRTIRAGQTLTPPNSPADD